MLSFSLSLYPHPHTAHGHISIDRKNNAVQFCSDRSPKWDRAAVWERRTHFSCAREIEIVIIHFHRRAYVAPYPSLSRTRASLLCVQYL